MKITSAIYLVFTAIVFLLQQIVCLYRDCIDSLTNPTLIACKLLSAGDFMKRLIQAQAAGMVIIPPYNKVQTNIRDKRSEAIHKRVVLSVNMAVLLALWIYAVFRRSKHSPNSKNQGGFVAKQALRFDKMLTAF